MKEYNFTISGTNFTRINRTKAKKEYTAGARVMFCASNLRPDLFGVTVDNTGAESFEKIENAFYYYNCINAETGKRINYFKEV